MHIHNQRTKGFTKTFTIVSLAQPSTPTKISKLSIYTKKKSQKLIRVAALKALHLHASYKIVHAVSDQT
jgi:hypothetical protein